MPHRLTLRWHNRSPDVVLRLMLESVPPTLSVYVLEAIPRPAVERLDVLVGRLMRLHDDPGMPAAVLLLGSRFGAVWTASLNPNPGKPCPLGSGALAALRDPPATGPWWTPTRDAVAALWSDHPDHELVLYLLLESLADPPYEWSAGPPAPPRRLGNGGSPPPSPVVVHVEAGGRAFPAKDDSILAWDRFLAELGARRPPPAAGPEFIRILLPRETGRSCRLSEAAAAAGWRLMAGDEAVWLVHPAFRSSAGTSQMELLILPEAQDMVPGPQLPVFVHE
ncbi:MAG TPA: hypothetical protein VD995_30965 [Azospirillum sp.]|nr:hypothetical protein [Azospirillum sp.]